MKLLEAGVDYMAYFGVRELRPGEKSYFNCRNVTVFVLLVLSFISCTAFVYFDANSFREYSEAFFPWISLLFLEVAYISNMLNARDFNALKENVEKSVDMLCFNPELIDLFKERNKLIDKCTKILHVLFLKVTIPSACIPPYLLSFYLYFTTDLGRNSFILYDYMKFPFDRKTLIGYAIAAAVESCSFIIICHIVFCVLSVLIGFYGVTTLAAECGLRKFHDLNQNCIIPKKYFKIHDEIRLLLLLHTQTKEMFCEFTRLMQFNISLYYIWSILAICDTLLMCQSADNFKEIVFPLPMMFWSFVQIFAFCELGERITNRFERFGNEVCECNWYTLPINVQKVFKIIMARMESPIVLNGIGNIQCTREAFKNVCIKGYSYFTTLRQFS